MENKGKNIEQAQASCYQQWMSIQSQRVPELKQALAQRRTHEGTADAAADDNKLRELTQNIIGDFKNYAGKRADLSHRCSSSYYAPSWNTPLENALIWMGGCRPSSFFRLVYALCGSQTEIRVTQFLRNIDGYDYSGKGLDVFGFLKKRFKNHLTKKNFSIRFNKILDWFGEVHERE